jgi:hypothetical protein
MSEILSIELNMSNCLSLLKQILFIILIFIFLPNYSQPQESNYLTLKQLQDQTIVFVELHDSLGKYTGYGSGCLLWDYSKDGSQEDSCVFLLTVEHVLANAHSLRLYGRGKEGGIREFTKTPIALRDSSSSKTYLVYTRSDGSQSDIALLKIEMRQMIAHPFHVLVRSNCAFADSVDVGDHLLAFGFPDYDTFDFVLSGQSLATSGVVAFETKTLYLMDKVTHKGMSGGIVFKEYPANSQFVYKAVGIVTANLLKYPDYSWIIKIDYVDSIFISLTGKRWGN